MFVELHMIQNFGPSCLNRDDTNTPKDCQFGGHRRARISSQCLKRAIREYFKTKIDEFKGNLGVRTRMLPKKVVDLLVENGKDEETALAVVEKVLKQIFIKDAKKKFKIDSEKKSEVLLFVNNNTAQNVADTILANWDDFNADKLAKAAENKLKPLLNEIKDDLDLDIALFGRMVASNANLKVDASCYVAHALSTHKVDMEMDFFTAVDDLQEGEDQGAGMMGIIMYNSSCFYRYSVLDLQQLFSNLQGDKNFAVSAVKGYIEASINAIPTGKQTSMAAFNKPDFIMVTMRSDQPLSLVNSFAKPARIGLKDSDLIHQSVEMLDSYLKSMTELYGKSDGLNIEYCLTGKEPLSFLSEIGTQHKSIKELLETLGEKVNECYSSSS